MNRLADLLRLLPVADWAGLGLFFAVWIGYAVFARRRARRRPSFLGSTNRVRRQWMLQTTYREVRVLDAIAVQQMSGAASFFASTTILIIGALLAAIGSTEKASDLVRELPFAARTSVLVFDLKLAVLTAIFVYAFFRFTWSIRQYSAGVLMIASVPEADAIRRRPAPRLCRARQPRHGAGGAVVQRWAARLLHGLCRGVVVRLAVAHGGGQRRRRLGAVPARVPLRGVDGAGAERRLEHVGSAAKPAAGA